MIKIQILLTILFLNIPFLNKNYLINKPLHPIHIAVSELQFNPKTKAVEISHKIFVDDLEEILMQYHKQKLHLGTTKEAKEASIYIQKYIEQNFKIWIDNKSYTPTWVGKEYEQDVAWLYFEIPNVKKAKQMIIQNQVLLDLFLDQSNLLYINYLGDKHTLRFRKEEIRQSIQL